MAFRNGLVSSRERASGTVLVAVLIVLASIFPFTRLGSEFMPPLNEGDLLYMPTTLPGISITNAWTMPIKTRIDMLSTGIRTPVAKLEIKKGPAGIKSENARRTAWLYVDLKDIDVGTYVKAAKKVVGEQVKFPAGYSIVWSGQYEYMERAAQRLRLVVPITLVIIFLLLYFNFRNISESLIIMLSLPFALVGGVWLMWLSGYNMSVAVGFIALAGIAAETGVIMLLYIDNAYKDRLMHGQMNTRSDLHAAVVHGAVERVRPKLMTVTTTIAGLLPIMWGTGTGSQVMKRIAAPMVGGLITPTFLTLIVIPAIYYLWKGR